MMVPGVFVIENTLPSWEKLAWPATTFGSVGAAAVLPTPKQAATHSAARLRRISPFLMNLS
jgi:hypothetical protein